MHFLQILELVDIANPMLQDAGAAGNAVEGEAGFGAIGGNGRYFPINRIQLALGKMFD